MNIMANEACMTTRHTFGKCFSIPIIMEYLTAFDGQGGNGAHFPSLLWFSLMIISSLILHSCLSLAMKYAIAQSSQHITTSNEDFNYDLALETYYVTYKEYNL
jgi:hypothetical protein